MTNRPSFGSRLRIEPFPVCFRSISSSLCTQLLRRIKLISRQPRRFNAIVLPTAPIIDKHALRSALNKRRTLNPAIYKMPRSTAEFIFARIISYACSTVA